MIYQLFHANIDHIVMHWLKRLCLALLLAMCWMATARAEVFIQISSHAELEDAVSRAASRAQVFPNAAVYRTENGFYAVVIERRPSEQAGPRLEQLKARRLVPQDAYATSGRRFVALVWSAQEQGRRAERPGTAVRIQGKLSTFTMLELERQLASNPNATTVVLDSPGGEIIAALAIALRIRNAGLRTHVPRAAICFSACSLIFSGGTKKTVSGLLGVHQLSMNFESNELTQFTLAEILTELGDFGVPEEFIDRMLRTPSDDIYVFSVEELQQFGWQ